MAETPSTIKGEKRAGVFPTILFAGLVAGLLDGAAAAIHYYISTGNNPTRVFQFIASAVFGKSAFSGGLEMAAWGVVLHFMVAFIFAAVFYFLYPLFLKLFTNKIVIGIAYGLVAWVIMNLVIVPLTRAPEIPFRVKGAITGMVILIFMVGIPISLIIGRRYPVK